MTKMMEIELIAKCEKCGRWYFLANGINDFPTDDTGTSCPFCGAAIDFYANWVWLDKCFERDGKQ
jgi:hypothetical protein